MYLAPDMYSRAWWNDVIKIWLRCKLLASFSKRFNKNKTLKDLAIFFFVAEMKTKSYKLSDIQKSL